MSGRCRTDCVEKPLSRALRSLGGLVGAYPWPFLLVPLVLSAALGVGFMQLPSSWSNDIEAQFTPQGRWGPAKADRRVAQKYFPTNDSENFSMDRLTTEGLYASLVMVAHGPNILNMKAFQEVLQLNEIIDIFRTADGYNFKAVCARNDFSCNSTNPIISSIPNSELALDAILSSLTFPLWGENAFMGDYLGNVTVDHMKGVVLRRPLLAAKALRLFYYLQEDEPEQREASLKWLKDFLQWLPDQLTKWTYVQVAYYSSLSKQEEFEKNTKEIFPLFFFTYALTICFSIMSCARLDCVRTKVWVAAFGVLSSGLAVVSSFGLLLFCGVPFFITAATAPFLILVVGVDDMFILVSCWQKTKVKDTIKDRMADTYAEAAVSVTIAMLIDLLAFYIGMATVFPSIQSFCIYTGTAFIFCYIYNLTFLGAILALNGKREESNKHWFTFVQVPSEIQGSPSSAYNMCCVGGSYDVTTGAEFDHPMDRFFRDQFGPFLVYTKVLVVILYLGYLASSIYGCTRVKEGIDFRNLASNHSYVIQYYDLTDEYFKEYGPRVMVIVPKSIPYWDPAVRADLESCMRSIENSQYVDEYLTESWLRTYIMITGKANQDIDNQYSFISNLHLLYNVNPNSESDINYTDQEISASRFFIQTVNVTSTIDKRNLLGQLRTLAADCKIPLIVYHPDFIYFDQYLVVQNTIQVLLITIGAILLISLLLIPSPLCSFWVTFSVVSVTVGVIGFMAFWDVNTDSISKINLVICIGISVEFSAHISYAYINSEKSSMNDKAIDALYHLGFPVVQGAVSTIVGILVLCMAPTYILRMFFKIMFLVILFGAVHGLIFIPVFLTSFGALQKCGQYNENSSKIEIVNNPVETPMKTLQEDPNIS